MVELFNGGLPTSVGVVLIIFSSTNLRQLELTLHDFELLQLYGALSILLEACSPLDRLVELEDLKKG